MTRCQHELVAATRCRAERGRALAAVSWYAEAKRRNAAQQNDRAPVVSRPAAQAMLQGKTGDVAEYAAKRVLAEYGIPVTREELAQSRDAAAADDDDDGGQAPVPVRDRQDAGCGAR